MPEILNLTPDSLAAKGLLAHPCVAEWVNLSTTDTVHYDASNMSNLMLTCLECGCVITELSNGYKECPDCGGSNLSVSQWLKEIPLQIPDIIIDIQTTEKRTAIVQIPSAYSLFATCYYSFDNKSPNDTDLLYKHPIELPMNKGTIYFQFYYCGYRAQYIGQDFPFEEDVSKPIIHILNCADANYAHLEAAKGMIYYSLCNNPYEKMALYKKPIYLPNGEGKITASVHHKGKTSELAQVNFKNNYNINHKLLSHPDNDGEGALLGALIGFIIGVSIDGSLGAAVGISAGASIASFVRQESGVAAVEIILCSLISILGWWLGYNVGGILLGIVGICGALVAAYYSIEYIKVSTSK